MQILVKSVNTEIILLSTLITFQRILRTIHLEFVSEDYSRPTTPFPQLPSEVTRPLHVGEIPRTTPQTGRMLLKMVNFHEISPKQMHILQKNRVRRTLLYMNFFNNISQKV